VEELPPYPPTVWALVEQAADRWATTWCSPTTTTGRWPAASSTTPRGVAADLGKRGIGPGIRLRLDQGDPATLRPAPAPDDSAPRWIYTSSGTTADPKAIRHTEGCRRAGDGREPQGPVGARRRGRL